MDVVTFGETMVQLNAKSVGPLESIDSWERHGAGAESNFAIGIARMGLDALWISRLGQDGFGRYIYNLIEENGVKISIKFDPSPTGIYFIWRPKEGESQVKYYRKGSAASKLSPQDLKEENFEDSKWLHLTGITPALSESCRKTCFKALGYAEKFDLKISFDLNWREALWGSVREAREIFERIGKRSDLVKAGLEEFRRIWGPDYSMERAARFLSDLFNCEVLVTRGRDSCVFNGGLIHSKAVKVEIVDPIGAGDAFMAGYLASKIKGLFKKESLKIANAAGSLVCTRKGDIEALPSWKEANEFLKKREKIKN